MLRTENELGDEDDPPVTIRVRLRRTEQMPFFEFVWKTLRQGLVATIKP